MLRSVRTMAPDEAIKSSTLHPQDPGGDDRLSHIPGETSCPTMSMGHIDLFPSALPPPAHDIPLCAQPTERQKKAENFENFLPRRPLKLAPIELPMEVQEAQREKIRSIWKEDEKPELGSHGKTLLLPVNQMTVGQRSGKKNKVQTPVQSGHGKVDIGQSDGRKAGRFKIHRAQQLDEDQRKSRFSSEGLKDDEGKPGASGATPRQRGKEKFQEKSSGVNPVGKVSEEVKGKESRRMAVNGIQEAAL